MLTNFNNVPTPRLREYEMIPKKILAKRQWRLNEIFDANFMEEKCASLVPILADKGWIKTTKEEKKKLTKCYYKQMAQQRVASSSLTGFSTPSLSSSYPMSMPMSPPSTLFEAEDEDDIQEEEQDNDQFSLPILEEGAEEQNFHKDKTFPPNAIADEFLMNGDQNFLPLGFAPGNPSFPDELPSDIINLIKEFSMMEV